MGIFFWFTIVPENGQGFGANILAAMLDTRDEIWDELVDGALVHH